MRIYPVYGYDMFSFMPATALSGRIRGFAAGREVMKMQKDYACDGIKADWN
jgi:hypothetical protein